MSVQESLPDIPRIPPPALKALSRLCAGDLEPASSARGSHHEITRAPCLVDLGDDLFVIFTDGTVAVLIQLDPEDDVPELASSEAIQNAANKMLKAFSPDTQDVSIHYNVDVGMLLHWASEGTDKCPKCGGVRTCMFSRLGYSREDQDVEAAHVGRVNDVYLDRRRVQVPLSFLEVEEGAVDVIVREPRADNVTSGLAILGDGWHLYVAGRNVCDEEKALYETCPRINL